MDIAYNGIDGLWRVREHPYDAVILDLMLPGINGYEKQPSSGWTR